MFGFILKFILVYTTQILYLEWAKWKNWYRKQPLWLIKKYFGVKLGLYFAWMGLYTQVIVDKHDKQNILSFNGTGR